MPLCTQCAPWPSRRFLAARQQAASQLSAAVEVRLLPSQTWMAGARASSASLGWQPPRRPPAARAQGLLRGRGGTTEAAPGGSPACPAAGTQARASSAASRHASGGQGRRFHACRCYMSVALARFHGCLPLQGWRRGQEGMRNSSLIKTACQPPAGSCTLLLAQLVCSYPRRMLPKLPQPWLAAAM